MGMNGFFSKLPLKSPRRAAETGRERNLIYLIIIKKLFY